ncbi:class I SAM-dependent RNA methyltransferase [Anaerovorax odorimutans]|uniref:Class I SAM-dependent RNA methyltransferase n=1 Tax=Anaerovorax odorimutans TaxID=109327 RepID=A0ABT1RSH4_9FIRM|nr:class I SAM-dependent RNA methyltransferase [Anaerovorax odorimutans]MCQ4638164.1 class I SAM-dependent RNA methyltransferase [Anaerovorax odorimutans]
MKLELIATATFGLEAVVKREIQDLGYKVLKTEDGKVTYMGDERAIVKSNLWLRSADRVLLKLGEFTALTFEELFQQIKGISWEELIPPDGKFTVTGSSVKSKLHSVPSCQSITKKAIVERLAEIYGITRFEETGAEYTIKVTLLKDRVTVTADTSGAGLHKRGYRVADVAAPIKETLAAAMVQLSFWKAGRLLADPCCGSGTIPIEAAMIGRNIAPGLGREFASEEWELIPKSLWKEERQAAFKEIDYDAEIRIQGSDIDKGAVEAARENAIEAGVDDCIDFHIMDLSKLRPGEVRDGIIITNPPYGERIGDKKAIERIYKSLSFYMKKNPGWSLFLITTDKEAEEKIMGRPADRRRKLYNGRLEVCYYQFHGKKEKKDEAGSR